MRQTFPAKLILLNMYFSDRSTYYGSFISRFM